MKCAHLFNGIAGFALAAHWMGWSNLMHCEIDPFCNRVMNYHFPNSFQHEDIRTTDFRIWRGRIDLLTGGFPCQPFSSAGKRLGKEDDRHLWPEMLRAIREISPRWVVGENVRGLVNWNGGLVFDEVQSDLETAGYEVIPFLLPACGVNAPHIRERIWFIAKNTDSNGWSDQKRENQSCKREQWDAISRNNERLQTDDGQVKLAPANNWRCGTTGQNGAQVNHGDERLVTNSKFIGQPGQGRAKHASNSTKDGTWKTSWSHDDGRWPTVTPFCQRDDGFPDGLVDITFSKWREESLRSAGNAIVPQVAHQIFKAIEQYTAGS